MSIWPMFRGQRARIRSLGALLSMSLAACGEAGDPGIPVGSGGSASGGQTTGGAGTGGSIGSGGTLPSGGRPGSGGVSALGGSMTGGASSGGAASSGSAPGSGGSDASGGASGVGGLGAGGLATGGAGSGGASPTFSPCPSEGACAILPLGDSITEGFASSGGGYRVEIFRQALEADKEITFVGSQQNGPSTVEGQPFPRNHQGHGGYTIDTDSGHSGISGNITNNAIDNYHPHIVLLMIGTNDINGNVDVNNAPTRLGNLIDSITSSAPDTLVVVASIVPVLNSGTNAKVLTYNAGVEQAVETRRTAGDHVLFVDNYEAIESQPNFSSSMMADNLHPNDAGYAVLGRSFYDAIEQFLP